jgi:hypothetical protein
MILLATDLSFVIVLCNEINPFNLEKISIQCLFSRRFIFIYFLRSYAIDCEIKSRLMTTNIDIIKSIFKRNDTQVYNLILDFVIFSTRILSHMTCFYLHTGCSDDFTV